MTESRGAYRTRHSRFRGAFNGICSLVMFLFLFFNRSDFLAKSFVVNSPSVLHPQWRLRGGFYSNGVEVIRRRTAQENVSSSDFDTTLGDDDDEEDGVFQGNLTVKNPKFCEELLEHKGYRSRCEYLIAHPDCNSGGIFNYIMFFYCNCESISFLGYLLLGIWLVTLIYAGQHCSRLLLLLFREAFKSPEASAHCCRGYSPPTGEWGPRCVCQHCCFHGEKFR